MDIKTIIKEEIQNFVETNKSNDKNHGVLKSTGKKFWIGTVSVLDGRIEEVHTYEEAEKYDFHHSFYFSSSAREKIDEEESMVFWVDKYSINGEWTHGKISQNIINSINQQILIK